MAEHTINRSHSGALPAMGGDHITSEASRTVCTVFNRGSNALWVRLDGTAATANGSADGDLVVPAGENRPFAIPDSENVDISINGVLSLAYSVELS